MVKAHDVATLQRLLKWLRWKDKCWCNLIAKESMLHNKNKQQQKKFVRRKAHGTFELKKKNQQRERASILISSLLKKEKKKKRKKISTNKEYCET